jgi:DNA processing protein
MASAIDPKSRRSTQLAGPACRYPGVASIVLTPGDARYPPLLRDLATVGEGGELGPPLLYVRGHIPEKRAITVVGTRKASDAAKDFARALVTDLVNCGFCIWSGGAVGIDAVAHEAAMDAGGVTVVVMGGGLDRQYPPENAALFERVIETGGALVSRVADEVPPLPVLFLQRNQVLAAAAQATVVIQAGHQSGARSTAAAARRIGRVLCAVPHAPWDKGGAGCALELALGARAITCAADVQKALGAPPQTKTETNAKKKKAQPKARAPALSLALALSSEHEVVSRAELSPDERAILRVLSELPVHVDEVCEAAALPPSRVVGLLLTLTLQAVVVEGPAGFYRRALRS